MNVSEPHIPGIPARPETRPLSLHMTATAQLPAGRDGGGGGYVWCCRCGAQAGGFNDRAFARKAGDAHLAGANAPRGHAVA